MKERFRQLGIAFRRALSFAGDIVILNLLFFLCSIPILTIGAAASACYAGLFRTLQKKETGMVFRAFFADFRASFGQATGGWLLMLLLGFILAGDVWFAVAYSEPDNQFFLYFAIISAAVLLLAALWFFPLTARFQNSLGTQVKNSFLLAFAQAPRSLLALLIWALMFGIPIFLFDIFMFFGWFWLLCGVSLPMYLTAKLFRNSLQLEPSKEEQEGQD
jgi:uncharacterized membrane protein YesL